MEAERYGRGRKPNDKTGRPGGTLGMKLPGKGEVTGHREGDWPPNASECADKMGSMIPGAGTPAKPDKVSG